MKVWLAWSKGYDMPRGMLGIEPGEKKCVYMEEDGGEA